MSNDTRLKGKWTAVCYGPDGNEKARKSGCNVVTTVGKEFLASFLNSAATAAATFTGRYIAVGTDSTGEAAGDTALGTEVTRTTGVITYVSGQIYRIEASFGTNSATGAIVEYGLLSSNTAGTLLTRDTEAVINVGASDTLDIVHELTIG